MKNILLCLVFLISTALILLNRYTSFYINSSILHFLILVLAVITFIFIAANLFGKLNTIKARLITILVVIVFMFIRSFLIWGGDWKTQTVLYQNIANSNKTIEFQMRGDRFSFGYKKRIINRLKLFPGFDWTTEIDTAAIDHKQWKKLNLYVNEMALKSN